MRSPGGILRENFLYCFPPSMFFPLSSFPSLWMVESNSILCQFFCLFEDSSLDFLMTNLSRQLSTADTLAFSKRHLTKRTFLERLAKIWCQGFPMACFESCCSILGHILIRLKKLKCIGKANFYWRSAHLTFVTKRGKFGILW